MTQEKYIIRVIDGEGPHLTGPGGIDHQKPESYLLAGPDTVQHSVVD